MEIVEYKGNKYPLFQTKGFASKYAFPFAEEVCKGQGYDIGCMKPEWSLRGSIPIDIDFEDGYHATNLPDGEVDYIFSSHCLEHIVDWTRVLDYWTSKIKSGGTLFLYLPDYSQVYWRPWNNKKHVNIFKPEFIKDYMEANGYKNVFVSGVDLYNAFMAMGEKE
jgi:predicted SAM-dependent methyltransferase